MNEQRTLLADTVEGLFSSLSASGEQMPDWQRVAELGITDLFLPEQDGGFGGCWQDAFVVMQAAGRHAIGLPVAESLLAGKLLRDAGVMPPPDPVTMAVSFHVELDVENRRITTVVPAVPWCGTARWLLTATNRAGRDWLLLLDVNDATQSCARDGADGEPRADLHFVSAPVAALVAHDAAVESIVAQGALMRTAQMAGALESLLEMTVTHVNQRVQFGRALAKFQVIQHQLALLAEEAAAVSCAARAACLALDSGPASFAIAASKLRANRAVQQSTSIAHQMHGAIGFTREHALHRFTQRLWHWRGDFGNERFWAERLGRMLTASGKAWELITAEASA